MLMMNASALKIEYILGFTMEILMLKPYICCYNIILEIPLPINQTFQFMDIPWGAKEAPYSPDRLPRQIAKVIPLYKERQ